MKKVILVLVFLVLLVLVGYVVFNFFDGRSDLVEKSPSQKEPDKKQLQESNFENNEDEEVQSGEAEELDQNEQYDSSLVAYWTFDNDANDKINNFQGKMNGGSMIKEGKMGNALFLDGVDSYVEFSDETLDKVGDLSQGTISFWFNYESLLDKQTVMPIIYIGNKQENPDNMYVIEIGHSAGDGSTKNPNPNDKKIYSTWISDNREPFLCFDSGENMKENTWHHYVVVVGPEGNQGYINGRLMENTDHNFGSSGEQAFLDVIKNKEIFLLGYGRSSFMISPEFVYYKGLIDELRIYDRPLDWIEVQELYNPNIV